ncbi:MAG TPA: RNA polymerase sigma factor [Bryobacteraceae bacterium]
MVNSRNFQYPHNTEYDQYRAELQRYFAKRARDPNAVDDLVQSVYERILKYTKDGSVHDTHAYIFKAAVNVLSDANKKAQVDGERVISCDPRTLERYAEDQGLEFSTPDSAAAMNEPAELGRAFRRLPRTAQEAWAHKRDGLSYKEIARKMNVTEHAVKKYISTALQGIREYLTRQRSNKHRRSPK